VGEERRSVGKESGRRRTAGALSFGAGIRDAGTWGRPAVGCRIRRRTNVEAGGNRCAYQTFLRKDILIVRLSQ
jgi:hypothetical protein